MILCPGSEGVEEYSYFSPLTWTNQGLSLHSRVADQDFCSFGSMTITPPSSNLFYIVDIHWVNLTRRVLL